MRVIEIRRRCPIYQFFVNSAVAGLFFGVMDALWFSLFLKNYSEKVLSPILRLGPNGLNAHMPSALVAYILMIVISSVFLVPRIDPESGLVFQFLTGAVMGLCIFGVFDFTNRAILNGYPLTFAIIDTLWGGFLYGILAVILGKIKSMTL